MNPRIFVTLKREVLKNIIREAVWKAIAAKVGAVNHTNRDAVYSPSSWWVDRDRTQRHTMSTSGSMSFAAGVLTINLDYSVQ